MTIHGDFITGAMFGIEFVDDDWQGKMVILDLLIYRVVFFYD